MHLNYVIFSFKSANIMAGHSQSMATIVLPSINANVFFNCPLLAHNRLQLFTDLGLLLTFSTLLHSLSNSDDRLQVLLYGNDNVSRFVNDKTCERVSQFILDSHNLLMNVI
jgi:hypothetical protein